MIDKVLCDSRLFSAEEATYLVPAGAEQHFDARRQQRREGAPTGHVGVDVHPSVDLEDERADRVPHLEPRRERLPDRHEPRAVLPHELLALGLGPTGDGHCHCFKGLDPERRADVGV